MIGTPALRSASARRAIVPRMFCSLTIRGIAPFENGAILPFSCTMSFWQSMIRIAVLPLGIVSVAMTRTSVASDTKRCGNDALFSEIETHPARDNHLHDFVGAGVDRLNRGVGIVGRDWEFAHESVSAVKLQ